MTKGTVSTETIGCGRIEEPKEQSTSGNIVISATVPQAIESEVVEIAEKGATTKSSVYRGTVMHGLRRLLKVGSKIADYVQKPIKIIEVRVKKFGVWFYEPRYADGSEVKGTGPVLSPKIGKAKHADDVRREMTVGEIGERGFFDKPKAYMDNEGNWIENIEYGDGWGRKGFYKGRWNERTKQLDDA